MGRNTKQYFSDLNNQTINTTDLCLKLQLRNAFTNEILTFTEEDLSDNNIVIGRGGDSDIKILDDSQISRKHCEIYLSEEGDWVLDSKGHEVYWSVRMESEWPEMRMDKNENEDEDGYREA
eukprot:CAMPEP_0205817256 /NCGR_PEP_ID=MMETSP0205-20121125/24024_1 /ASSEMBLY_ACC=CAM_ASM_000278 /TAXON_ID=36767 /ORGANISM="Euplotes focardii, Strain TN1" /LENGTH=120 /DNA_ID=CAMNT_0053107381 /DNA_START=116 /DNA_END=474 /DNA_ORIENTATION=+